MNKKILSAFIIIAALAFIPISTKADYPTGTLGFSDEIVAGNTYEWSVAKLDVTGDFASYTSDMYIGNDSLSEGVTIKIEVTDDPDNGGDWFDMFINNNPVSGDPYDIGFDLYSYGIGGFFINPVTYDNGTGVYNIYEQVLEELENIDESTETSYQTYGITYSAGLTERVTFSIRNDIFVMEGLFRLYTSISGGGYDVEMEMVMEQTITINTLTGLLGIVEMKMDADTPYGSGTVHLLINSGYAKTPFSWAFSFLGLTVIAAVVGITKRKR
jgi:hypothetical protein